MSTYWNPDMPLEDRVRDLVSRMTPEEKLSQLLHDAPAIERLGVPAYNWWNEALHGVARAGTATVFPQAIGLAATFDPESLRRIASVISDEARAKHHESVRQGDRGIYKGLTMWSPNVNIFRDPRWGRGHETYGEDPFLTATLGVAFINGLQGNDPNYLKVAACAKHFAVHSGPERNRESFDSIASIKDMFETYLPAFRACVTDGQVEAIMSAYNRLNGEPCSTNEWLLGQLLREEWGFDGHVVSDCGAIYFISEFHQTAENEAEAAAKAVAAGCELHCAGTYRYMLQAYEEGKFPEDVLTRAAERVLRTRFRLGMFDPEERVPYASIPYEIVDCLEHQQLSRQAARESIVLLKNDNNLLPLPKTLRSIAVIGPNAADRDTLLGNYHGTPSRPVTILDGIRQAVSPETRVYYAKGCELLNNQGNSMITALDRFYYAEALSAAHRSDVVVLCLGLSARIEGENGDANNSDAAGDRVFLELPSVQQELMEQIHALGKPIVLVLQNGSALAINWAQEHIPGIIEAWYPGGQGGEGVADILFGDYSPSGRLPVTFPATLDDLPPFEDYAMTNRTYRYSQAKPLYPFGYGLSYTIFTYSALSIAGNPLEGLQITATVTNTGTVAGSEVAQLYVEDVEASIQIPRWQLKGIRKVAIQPHESAVITFELKPSDLALVNEEGAEVIEPGLFRFYVGGSQPDARSEELTGTKVLFGSFRIEF
ncbi:glycoside hydrolase family 3 C-terminal domain-containing protein [Paenibacillus sp. ATY16]|uniref:glycoside hydrolase family 3 C-terminal domain-containing protein n=1 Tax=Paenibacillus sp. ATY16 TaxID=1759312 RepID=UPI00200DBD53|nr:glycoside hydrolase family 3 C-terminal domain-containing protein [Paenibacillus sp. ATY16]MCK9858652.1 glycoside hydrolase family 3 C-terminal domain-containing protein [Paenibacillus sp. ATY16]